MLKLEHLLSIKLLFRLHSVCDLSADREEPAPPYHVHRDQNVMHISPLCDVTDDACTLGQLLAPPFDTDLVFMSFQKWGNIFVIINIIIFVCVIMSHDSLR